MKTPSEILEAMDADMEAHYEKCKKECGDWENEPMKAAILIVASDSFRKGFAAGVKRATEE